MQKNRLMRCDDKIIRILKADGSRCLVIDCIQRTMPKWIEVSEIEGYMDCSMEELLQATDTVLPDMEELSPEQRKIMHERYTMIAGVLPFVADEKQRSKMIEKCSDEMNVSKQTIRKYLCLYLIYQDVAALAPLKKKREKILNQNEKNMRWALNKFFYNRHKNSLKTAYTMMLKSKYCDKNGVLLPEYPSFYQFRYYYRQNRSLQTYYISRNGLTNYQRNNRPLTGDGIQQFAPAVGVGMLDATICDIYLVNDSGSLVGRPILTACIDAYSGLCCGYSLSWEGGVYSLRSLMLNVVTDKVKWCQKFGISIEADVWPCTELPATLVTDMGNEYVSGTFTQIAELGVKVVNLPPYRPELKGAVEKFFDLVQSTYKKHLKGKGLIEPDFQERGVHDYRKDACLTMEAFEKVILYCIIYYNSKRIIDNFPYTEEMLQEDVQPFASCIWKWSRQQVGSNLIRVEQEQLILTLLPRVEGKFCRNGLKVNKLRYHREGYAEQYLCGGSVTVAYNPDDTTMVWLIQDGLFTAFQLIEERYERKAVDEVWQMQKDQKSLVKRATMDSLQAQIDLAEHIEVIASTACVTTDTKIKDIRNTRKKEQNRTHVDYTKRGVFNG